MLESSQQNNMYIEEEVLFHRWLMSHVKYPANLGLWQEVCSLGLRNVLPLLYAGEFEAWKQWRAMAIKRLGERFVQREGCNPKHIQRDSDESIRESRRHWQIAR